MSNGNVPEKLGWLATLGAAIAVFLGWKKINK